MQDGEAVLDESAHRAPPRVFRHVPRLTLDQQHRLRERRLQAHRLLEQPAVTDRRTQVGLTLALHRQVRAEHVVADRQLGQLHLETCRDQRVGDAADALAMVDQHRT